MTSSSGSDTAFDASIHTYPTALKLALGFALERLVAEMAREDVQILMQPGRLSGEDTSEAKLSGDYRRDTSQRE